MHKVSEIIGKALAIFLAAIGGIIIIIFATGVYLYRSADFKEPGIHIDKSLYTLDFSSDSLRICKGNSLALNKYGLWEAFLQGSAAERGAAFGAMGGDLLYYQEKVFVDQIHRWIPDDGYLDLLHKFIIIFNRKMAEHVPDEYREEIFAMSQFCSDDFNEYGSPYLRQLNYHSAHDIGHAMQEYMLVGCSSFTVTGGESKDGKLLVGRNFDFYAGDDFAAKKVVFFVKPDSGHCFASISWPGMTGVLSGMNTEGLTVTINAAKGPVPTASAMPVSILARQILQYASDIDEAYRIAQKAETFVSESLLIGSAKDGKSAIIEKTPEKIALFEPEGERTVCTNHYQSDIYSNDKYNVGNIGTTDSKYRFDRLEQLLDGKVPIDQNLAAEVLRDRKGLDGKDIGLGNPKSINQSIANHSVIFKPGELKMWVSTFPWQDGEYICYDLGRIFGVGKAVEDGGRAIQDPDDFGWDLPGKYVVIPENIGADYAFLNGDYNRLSDYRTLRNTVKEVLRNHRKVRESMADSLTLLNPEYFEAWETSADCYAGAGNMERARKLWQTALSKEIPYEKDIQRIRRKIND